MSSVNPKVAPVNEFGSVNEFDSQSALVEAFNSKVVSLDEQVLVANVWAAKFNESYNEYCRLADSLKNIQVELMKTLTVGFPNNLDNHLALVDILNYPIPKIETNFMMASQLRAGGNPSPVSVIRESWLSRNNLFDSFFYVSVPSRFHETTSPDSEVSEESGSHDYKGLHDYNSPRVVLSSNGSNGSDGSGNVFLNNSDYSETVTIPNVHFYSWVEDLDSHVSLLSDIEEYDPVEPSTVDFEMAMELLSIDFDKLVSDLAGYFDNLLERWPNIQISFRVEDDSKSEDDYYFSHSVVLDNKSGKWSIVCSRLQSRVVGVSDSLRDALRFVFIEKLKYKC